MALPRMHSDEEYCLYSNDKGQHVGSCALDVRGWLAEHPEYRGSIWGDWDLGGSRDHFDATTMFFPEADEDDETPTLGSTTEALCEAISRTTKHTKAA